MTTPVESNAPKLAHEPNKAGVEEDKPQDGPAPAVDMKKILRQCIKDPEISKAFRNPKLGPITRVIMKDPSCLANPTVFFAKELAADPELAELADQFLPKLNEMIAKNTAKKPKPPKPKDEEQATSQAQHSGGADTVKAKREEPIESAESTSKPPENSPDPDRPSEADNMTKEDEAELSDLDEFDVDQPASTEKITVDEANALRKLIFGDELATFNEAWKKQGFFFTKESDDIAYGLIQTDGGPCGAVAAVQAFVLRSMLFNDDDGSKISDAQGDWKTPNKKAQRKAVINALAKIIWGCSISKTGKGDKFCKITKNRPAKICVPQEKAHYPKTKNFKHDGVTEKLNVTTCYNYDDVLDTIKANSDFFMEKKGGGVVCVVYSCLLSRTVELIKTDMDSNFGISPKMIGNHGYASQEMVNLFLAGVASSNMFDGEKRLEDDTGSSDDCVIMGGIPSKSDVGFLTLFEAFGNVSVGDNFKAPTCPIWVVCSESHYSVLFSPLVKHAGEVDEKRYGGDHDIYYYDPLGEQEEEIRLTLDFHPKEDVVMGGEETDCVPPINKVVRTKWGAVGIDWNGVDEIL